MGAFVTSLYVGGAVDQSAIAALRAELAAPAYAQASSDAPWAGIYPAAMDQQSPMLLELGARISRRLSRPVICVNIHDSDICELVLVEGGAVVDSYNSWPGYFEGHSPEPQGGDPAHWLRFCLPEVTAADIEAALRPDVFEDEEEDRPDAVEIASAAGALLGLPRAAAHASFSYIDKGEDFGAMIWLDV